MNNKRKYIAYENNIVTLEFFVLFILMELMIITV